VRPSLSDIWLLKAQGLQKVFADRSGSLLVRRHIEAVHDLSFALPAGGSLGIVGESGSGKSTTARMIVGLEAPTAGSLEFEGQPLATQPTERPRAPVSEDLCCQADRPGHRHSTRRPRGFRSRARCFPSIGGSKRQTRRYSGAIP
jgi:ABC-type oligopeptide transport system ATPase subunit